MKLKLFAFILIFTFNIDNLLSQSNLLNAKDPEDIGKKDFQQQRQDEDKKLEYGYVDERDILFSKVIWEVIDLDQKVNFPYLYPIDTSMVGKERRPLIHYILEGLRKGKIKRAYADGKFNTKLSWDDITSGYNSTFGGLESRSFNEKKTKKLYQKYQNSPEVYLMRNEISIDGYPANLKRVLDSVSFIASENGGGNPKPLAQFEKKRDSILYNILPEDHIDKKVFEYADIDHYKIKGVWYFDKKIAELKYRPLAIAPVARQVIAKKGNEEKQNFNTIMMMSPNYDKNLLQPLSDPKEMFWIYYPDAREVLKESFVFSDKNSAIRKSFDELINARRFHTMVYLEENMYEDRLVEDYVPDNAFMRLLESERIKEKIRNFEHDMWSW